MTARLADVIAALDAAYPRSLAESWDTGIGLTCGDPGQEVRHVLLAVDVDPVTVGEAVDIGAQLLVTHPPLLFRPVQSVAADTPKGSLLHRLMGGGIAHFAAHTNADRAPGGVNDALADALGLRDPRPLVPAPPDPLDKIVVFVPAADTDRLIAALAAAFGLVEWLRTFVFTGFPWNPVGYAAMPVPLLMQSASVVGSPGRCLISARPHA